MAFGVILFGLLLYLPFAGTYGLWDPWETHYSEVARQMTYRGDFISLWWPGSPRDLDVFWSKPVLSFWLMSIGMHIARIGLHGGDPGEMALSYRAEWAVRTPFVLTGVLGIYAVYLVTARFVNRRAGVLAAVVVATAPMYSLVARQAMTDMAFVGPMAMALALGAMALFDDRDELLPRRGRGRFTWPHHGLFYGGARAVRAHDHPAAGHRFVPAARRDPLERRRAQDVRRGRDDSVLPRLRRVRRAGGAHAVQGAALPLHRGDPVRAVGAGQGAGGAGAAADRLHRVPRLHLELAAAAARAAALRRGGVAGGADRRRGALAPRDDHPPRHGVLERAVRRQPLAAHGAGPPRRPRHVRVLPARARLRDPAVGRGRAGGAGLGGHARRRRASGRDATATRRRGR